VLGSFHGDESFPFRWEPTDGCVWRGGGGRAESFPLDGRVALVAGGSGGIGVRVCGAPAGVGARVAIVGRSEEGLRAAREAVEAAGSEALVLLGDMAREGEADGVLAATMEAWGRLDVLVNAIGSGAGTALTPAERYPEPEWGRILDLNLRSAFLVPKAAARAMIAGGRGGRILNLSPVRRQLGIDSDFSAYVAAKSPERAQAPARDGELPSTGSPTTPPGS